MPPIDKLLSQYSEPVRSWPGEEWMDEEARANYAAANPRPPQPLRPDERYRGAVLPFRETTDGRHEWAVPGLLQDVFDSARAVRDTTGLGLGPALRPSQMRQEEFDQMLGHGMAGAMTGVTGGLARAAVSPRLAAGEMELGAGGGRRAAAELPMDQASKLARAREMGFDVDNPLYVSALQPIQQFEPHGKFMGNKGISGISLTDSPAMANRYLDRYGQYDFRGNPFNKNVMKVYIRPGEVMEFSEAMRHPVSMGDPLPKDYRWPRSLDGIDTAIFPDRITKRGNVAHLGPDSGRPALEGKEYILRDPSRVRSVNADFDPAKINSRDLMASHLAPLGFLGGAAALTLEDILSAYGKE